MADIDIPSLRQSLHDARHSESEMADWARRHGAELLDACEPVAAEVASVVSDEIVQPEQDQNGDYETEFGNIYKSAERIGEWFATVKNGHELRTKTAGDMIYFSTPLEAAKVLRDAAKGAGG